jgi:hypothetical protein
MTDREQERLRSTRDHLKHAWHVATFLQGAQTDCAKHLFDRTSRALRQIDDLLKDQPK